MRRRRRKPTGTGSQSRSGSANGLERWQAQGFLEDWADAQTGAAFRSSRPIGGISEEKLMKIIYTDVLVIGGGLAGLRMAVAA